MALIGSWRRTVGSFLASVVRPLLVAGMGVALAALGGHVFNQWMWSLLLVPAAVGLVVIGVHRWGGLVEAGVALVASVGVTVGVTVAAGGSFGDVVPGVSRGPKRLLSTEWPSPNDPTMIATVGLFIGVCTAVGVMLALRPRWRLLPLIPLTVCGVVLLGLGAPVRPAGVWLVVLGTLAVAVAARGGSDDVRTGWATDHTVAATVVLMALATVSTASAVAWADRSDPRRTNEAEQSAILLDPIEATVAMRRAEPVVDLMTIRDRSLLARAAMPARWRVAAFDEFDGQRWVPQLDVRPIGGRLGTARPGEEASRLDYSVTYHGSTLDLVPFPGTALSVDRDVETDLDRVVVRLRDTPGADTIVIASSIPSPSLATSLGLQVTGRQVDDIAATFTDEAMNLAGEGTELERLGRLAQTMRTEWELDSGAPGAGQQLALIERFSSETRRGTREQFVTGFALLARSLGIETRIAAGFVVPPDDVGSTFTIRTDQAAVWPEVRLEDGTWLPFDPVPDEEAIEDDEELPPPDAQTPAAAQPPIAPPADNEGTDDDVRVDEATGGRGWATVRVWAVRVGTVGGIALGPFLLAAAAVLGAKWRRRRGRVQASDPVARVRGVWANVTDSFVDAGLSIAPSWTDDRIADGSTAVVRGVVHETRRLAAMSAAVTFGTRSREEATRVATDAAAMAAAIESAIRSNRTRWERLRWRLSLRSLRRSTRSPVTP